MYILDTDHLSVLDRGGINAIPIIDFDINAANEFQRIRKLYPRLGTMDLKIAAIAIVNNAIVLTRNTSDFGQIANLQKMSSGASRRYSSFGSGV
jgi:hypothetical protein